MMPMGEAGKDRFLRVYANLPMNLRKEIIAVVDKEPVSWEVAYREISSDTKLGQKVLKKLVELEVI